MTPEEFIATGPQTPEDLIGKARSVAQVFIAKIRSGNIAPIRLLCFGPPGIGKSATCKIIANVLVDHPVYLRHMSAKEITVEHVRDWMHEISYYNDRWRAYWIEEVDAVNPDVETLLLQFMDKLPERNAVLVTSNERMSGIEDRFQSRCKAIKFERPSVGEVERFLLARWPELGAVVAREIAEANNGDVRASLNDCQLEIDFRKFGRKS